MSGIPITTSTVYNQYGNAMSFPVDEISAVMSFFEQAGYDTQTASNITIILLGESRNTGTNVFELVESLKALDPSKMTSVIAQLLNNSRNGTSVIGYRTQNDTSLQASRAVRV